MPALFELSTPTAFTWLRYPPCAREQTMSAPVEATLWGYEETRDLRWLVRLSNGQLALSTRVGTKWSLFEGSRDDVLATVPDDRMDEAVRAVLG